MMFIAKYLETVEIEVENGTTTSKVQLHQRKNYKRKVFKKGFWIEPLLGHLFLSQ